jgi:hypothetical protein
LVIRSEALFQHGVVRALFYAFLCICSMSDGRGFSVPVDLIATIKKRVSGSSVTEKWIRNTEKNTNKNESTSKERQFGLICFERCLSMATFPFSFSLLFIVCAKFWDFRYSCCLGMSLITCMDFLSYPLSLPTPCVLSCVKFLSFDAQIVSMEHIDIFLVANGSEMRLPSCSVPHPMFIIVFISTPLTERDVESALARLLVSNEYFCRFMLIM